MVESRKFWGLCPLTKVLTSFTRVLPSWPNHLPSTPSPNAVTLGIQASAHELGRCGGMTQLVYSSRGWNQELCTSSPLSHLKETDLLHLIRDLLPNPTSSQMNDMNQGITCHKNIQLINPGHWPQWPSSAGANACPWGQGSVTQQRLSERSSCPSLCLPGLSRHPTREPPSPETRFPKGKWKNNPALAYSNIPYNLPPIKNYVYFFLD